MIAISKFKETQRLLALGNLSQRKIALVVGVSRATVGAIAAGKYRHRVARERARAEQCEPVGPLGRCRGCGGLVHLPCRLCRVEAIKDEEHEILLARRRQARKRALVQLLVRVRKTYWEREAAEEARARARYLPARAAAGAAGPLDCK